MTEISLRLLHDPEAWITKMMITDSIFQNIYCGIIVRGGPMLVAFVGNPCPWIYIPTKHMQANV